MGLFISIISIPIILFFVNSVKLTIKIGKSLELKWKEPFRPSPSETMSWASSFPKNNSKTVYHDKPSVSSTINSSTWSKAIMKRNRPKSLSLNPKVKLSSNNSRRLFLFRTRFARTKSHPRISRRVGATIETILNSPNENERGADLDCG